jgi:hypothetical protein
MANAARITVFSSGDSARQAPHSRPGGIRLSARSREGASPQRRPETGPSADEHAKAAERERRAEQRKAEERAAAGRQARSEQERGDRQWARGRAEERQRERQDPGAESNDSGTKSAKLPRSARGWNTAAFLLGPVWGPANGVWIGVVGIVVFFIPNLDFSLQLMIYLAFGALLGIKGNQLAWRAKRWSSIEHFKKVQQLWMMFALVVNIFLLIGVAMIASRN